MKSGRLPEWNILATRFGDAWLDVVEVSKDSRVALPIALRRRVSWAMTECNLPLLAVAGGDGSIALSPLEDREQDLELVSRLISGASQEDAMGLILTAMASHTRLALQPDGRLRLSPPIIEQLGAREGQRLWVSAHEDQVRLWSIDGFQTRYAESFKAFKQISATTSTVQAPESAA